MIILLTAVLFAFIGVSPGLGAAEVDTSTALLRSAPGSQQQAVREDRPSRQIEVALRALRTTSDGDYSIDLWPFYLSRGFAPVFSGGPEQVDRGRAVLAALRAADTDGLDPRDYDVDRLTRLFSEESVEGRFPSAAEQVDFELHLAAALVRYASDVATGRVGPEGEQEASYRRPPGRSASDLLNEAATAADPKNWLEALPPVDPRYRQLRSALAFWQARRGRTEWTQVPAGRRLEPGVADPAVVALRMRLVEEGLSVPPAYARQWSALYDRELTRQVVKFQTQHGLEADGVVGARTFHALDRTVGRRVEQIRVNMERLRWLPRDPGVRHIFVNLADYSLNVVDRGRVVRISRVVVGAPATATPSMSQEISYVVLNPYWHVPRSVTTREILPELKRDSGWLAKDGFRLFSGRGPDAVEVDPRSIDWPSLTTIDWRYRVRQEPGPTNSLGVIKFMFPNADDIYLHDTPAKYLFGRHARAFSHGCIRVEDPLALADLLLSDQGWPRARLEEALTSGKPELVVPLAHRIPVHLAYLTAVVDTAGRLLLLDDIYGRDARLADALRGKFV